jgi:hypothetical protein
VRHCFEFTYEEPTIRLIDELADGIAERRLRLLKQAVPNISRVAVLSSAPTETGHRKAFAEAEHAATALGVKLETMKISDTSDLTDVFSELPADGPNAVFCSGGILSRPVVRQIVELAAKHRRPAMVPYTRLRGAWRPDVIRVPQCFARQQPLSIRFSKATAPATCR